MPQAAYTRDEIIAAIAARHAESVDYWRTFDTTSFFAPIGAAWSPSFNVRHLTKSMRAVTRGLTMPRMVLRVTFGKADAPSRTYDEIRSAYYIVLANGGQAGAFTPSSRDSPADDEARAGVMHEHATAVHALCAAIRDWPDEALDAYRLPHPLLGKLTVREMLLFTLYHNEHHVNNVKRHLASRA